MKFLSKLFLGLSGFLPIYPMTKIEAQRIRDKQAAGEKLDDQPPELLLHENLRSQMEKKRIELS